MGIKCCSDLSGVRPLEKMPQRVAAVAVALVALAMVGVAFHALLAPASPLLLHGLTVPVGFSVGGVGLAGVAALSALQFISTRPGKGRRSDPPSLPTGGPGLKGGDRRSFVPLADGDGGGGGSADTNTSTGSAGSATSCVFHSDVEDVGVGGAEAVAPTTGRRLGSSYSDRPPSLRGVIPLEWETDTASEQRSGLTQDANVATYLRRFVDSAQSLQRRRRTRDTRPTTAPDLDGDKLRKIGTARRQIQMNRPPEGATVHSSGENIVFELKDIPGFVFKAPKAGGRDSAFADEYVRLRDEARRLCDEEQLYMLHIPQCHVVETNGYFFIAEEVVPELYGEYHFQKSLYRWIGEQPDLQPYLEKLLTQLTTFVGKFGFADVKADNIPLDVNTGRIVLIDLDQDDALTGLTEGCAEDKKDGVFVYAPIEGSLLEALRDTAATLVEGDALFERGEAIRKRRLAREEWRGEYKAHIGERDMFAQVQELKEATHPQRRLIGRINKLLAVDRASCLPTYGRRLNLRIGSNDVADLAALKKAEVIYDFKIRPGNHAIVYA